MVFKWSLFRRSVWDALFDESGAVPKKATLAAAGKKCKVSASTLSRVINGKVADLDSVLSICSGLKLDLNSFIVKGKDKYK